jgi:diguanylate cyclase (GGDEF)-like protein
LSAAWQIEDATERSRTDPLTGLGNRRHFDEQLARVLDEADRYERTCALVLADVDHFKRVNDSLGHEAGDEVLKMVAGVLRDGARSTDIWTRVGGEEFCIVLPESELAGATDFAERQRKRVEAAVVRWRGEEVRVTCSFGVATYGKSAGAVKRAQLFGLADRALYRAKQGGRNRVEPAGP